MRAGAGGQDEGTKWEWKWGPRAHAEVGELAIARFVAEFMVRKPGSSSRRVSSGDGDGEEGDGDGDGDGEEDGGEGERKVVAMVGAIKRAAGGELLGVR